MYPLKPAVKEDFDGIRFPIWFEDDSRAPFFADDLKMVEMLVYLWNAECERLTKALADREAQA